MISSSSSKLRRPHMSFRAWPGAATRPGINFFIAR